MTETGPAPEFLTVREVAKRMRVHPMTVYRLIHAGKLACHRVTERGMRVPAAAVDAHLAATAVQA